MFVETMTSSRELWETFGERLLPGVPTVYPALALSVAALVVGSLVTPAPPPEAVRLSPSREVSP